LAISPPGECVASPWDSPYKNSSPICNAGDRLRILLYNSSREEVVAMLKVKGIYRNGVVELLEPVEAPEQAIVEVTFMDEPSETRELTEAQKAALDIIGLLEDLTPEQQRLFDEATERSPDFFGDRELGL
jgi:hypothetical protein